ncbi:hypothetical protein B0H34DRAFT_722198 [Crassisporium funariophilum]|nr:hypothetical protein B0H34DRAFT_722198 [Crassisporium funariophilum]
MLPNHPLYDPPLNNNNQNAHTLQAAPPIVPPPVYQLPPGPPPAPQVVIPAPLSGPPTQINVSLPLNTAVVGGIVSHIHVRFPTDISFVDFISRACASMDLEPGDAELGYKFLGDLVWDPPSRLQTEDDLREMMRRGVEKIQRARTWEVSIIIHNLRPAQCLVAGTSRKRPAPTASDADEPDTTLTFVRELRELKRLLECQRHKGKHCYVSPVNGKHQMCSNYKLSYWAKQIFLNQATYCSPPEQLQFDHVAKRARRKKPLTPTERAQPHIHVHIPHTLFLPPLLDNNTTYLTVSCRSCLCSPHHLPLI